MTTTTSSALTKKAQSENIKSQKNRILHFFKTYNSLSFTSIDIDWHLNMKNSQKRISELLREGLICHVGRLKLDNKWYNQYIYSSPEHREKLKKAMFEQDFKAWLKQGEKFKDLVEIIKK